MESRSRKLGSHISSLVLELGTLMLMCVIGTPVLVLALTGLDLENSGVVFRVCKPGKFVVRFNWTAGGAAADSMAEWKGIRRQKTKGNIVECCTTAKIILMGRNNQDNRYRIWITVVKDQGGLLGEIDLFSNMFKIRAWPYMFLEVWSDSHLCGCTDISEVCDMRYAIPEVSPSLREFKNRWEYSYS